MLNDWYEGREEEAHGVMTKQLNGFPISPKIAEALAGCRWPGRSQLFRRGNVLFHLDGAHTPQSIQVYFHFIFLSLLKKNLKNGKLYR
jgi:folylpolyglutamate synthase/dihydropteroate synthase